MKPAVEMAGGGQSNSSPPPPHHHPISQLITVDISFKDDVTVNFLLGVSFMVLPILQLEDTAPPADKGIAEKFATIFAAEE
jgi:hypothetical protein